jgi:hypothetical protein
MATTRAKRGVAGVLPEDRNKNPSRLEIELEKIYPKKRKQRKESVRQGDALEQSKMMPVVVAEPAKVDELPYAEVQPLPLVTRGHTKPKDVVSSIDDVVKLLETPKLTVEPGFKNRAPLQLDERAKELIQEALKNPICITTEDLLNVSEPMRQELKKLLIKKRLEKKSVTLAAEVEPRDDEGTLEQRTSETMSVPVETTEPPELKKSETLAVEVNPKVDEGPSGQRIFETISVEKLPGATYEVLAEDTNGMAKGSVVVSDPVMQYFNTLAPGEAPKKVIVAAESHALRTVYPLINGVGEVESLLDPGSQIVSMSKAVASMLQVTWDPDITVHMESANKALEKTLGLAKNVPFLFGPITVYLQVHVIEKVAYKVLLGRPFDTITESEIKNSMDGSQSLTLTDLNTGERCVMHTHERGKAPTVLKRPVKQDFVMNSMN